MNCSEDVLKMYGKREILSIISEERTIREEPSKEKICPYESNIRMFMIDNNKEQMYCCALVYDMPHRIRDSEKALETHMRVFWNSFQIPHPHKVVVVKS